MPNPLLRAMRAAIRVRRRMRGPMRPSWNESFETWARFLHHYGKRSTKLPLAIQRGMLRPAPSTRLTRSMRFETVSARGVPAEWFRAPDSDEDRVLLYLHGGGYALGSIGSHRELVSRLCVASGMRALVIDYRRAPEHPFPAQLDDALSAYRWLLDEGVDPSRIAIAGESAGGGLTLSTLVSLRDAHTPLPAAAAVISPWVDLEATGDSMVENARYDYVTRESLQYYARCFARDDQLRDPLASPIHADLRGLPPLLVQAGGAETLLDDARGISARAREAGVDVTLEVEPEMIHVWHMFAPLDPRGQKAIDRVGAFIAGRVGRRAQERGAAAVASEAG
jgi:monoterpene epsilon-lactone hydrolase